MWKIYSIYTSGTGVDMIKILYVNGGTMDRGGVSTFMMNVYEKMHSEKIQIDFLVHTLSEGVRDEDILNLGGKIFRVPARGKNPLKNYRQIKQIMLNGNYDVVHAHADAGNRTILSIAKECDIPIRISHCHNTNYTNKSLLKKFLNEQFKKQIPRYATHLWACSEKAGEWLYGNHSFEVIPNAIDVQKFIYSPQLSKDLRKELNLENKFVIGHVGRFDYQKNHDFLLKVFTEFINEREDAHLVLIGKGELEEVIKKQANHLGILDKISFLGESSNVNELINVFDVGVFPSLFEGFSIAMVEMQVNGLPLVVSDNVPSEINLTDNIRFLSLDETVKYWCKTILETKGRDTGAVDKIIAKGYNLSDMVHKLTKTYERIVDKS
uniref:Putative glycosyl transferase n=2 Tax=Streptococcus pneumoniae TaxID=1313 RepID=Q4JYQ3_STREE|nr:putative glycosyl transferase [Streptococcus pneumoniae]